jgi:hypothetical protein
MRILFTVLSFSLLLSLTTHAQISIGVKAGPDFSRLINAVNGANGGGDISNLNSGKVTQLYGGVFVDIPLDTNKLFYIRPGIEYVGGGGQIYADDNFTNTNGFQPNTKYTLRYVDVPVEFVFSPTLGGVRPWIGLGLYTGALVSGKMKTDGSSSESVAIGNGPNDNFQRIDFGYTFSLGMRTEPGFMFGLDYQHGFLQVVPDTPLQNSQARLSTRNALWALHVGWIFKLGKKA